MQATSAKEYRKDKTMFLTLPSGAIFKIGKPSGETMASLLTLFDIEISAEKVTKENMEQEFTDMMGKINLTDKIADFLRILIPDCVKEPKVTLNKSEVTDEVLLLQELDQADQFALLDGIMKFAGFSKEATEERKSFPG